MKWCVTIYLTGCFCCMLGVVCDVLSPLWWGAYCTYMLLKTQFVTLYSLTFNIHSGHHLSPPIAVVLLNYVTIIIAHVMTFRTHSYW